MRIRFNQQNDIQTCNEYATIRSPSRSLVANPVKLYVPPSRV